MFGIMSTPSPLPCGCTIVAASRLDLTRSSRSDIEGSKDGWEEARKSVVVVVVGSVSSCSQFNSRHGSGKVALTSSDLEERAASQSDGGSTYGASKSQDVTRAPWTCGQNIEFRMDEISGGRALLRARGKWNGSEVDLRGDPNKQGKRR